MALGVGSYGLGLLAGALSTLSPCVLPVVPILVGSAVNAHPRAPLALAGGLALSYAVLGTGLAWASGAMGFDSSALRVVGAVMLGLLGLLLMSASLQQRFASATAGLGGAGHHMLDFVARLWPEGLGGQFVIGLLLGVVWVPCVGPTLGAALVLARQGEQLPQVALLMGLFGVGAALPLLLLARLSRQAMQRMRGLLLAAGRVGRGLMGALLVLLSALMLSGADKALETWLVDHSPDWLTALTTRF